MTVSRSLGGQLQTRGQGWQTTGGKGSVQVKQTAEVRGRWTGDRSGWEKVLGHPVGVRRGLTLSSLLTCGCTEISQEIIHRKTKTVGLEAIKTPEYIRSETQLMGLPK